MLYDVRITCIMLWKNSGTPRNDLTSSSESMASLKLLILGGGCSNDASSGSSSSKECWSLNYSSLDVGR